MIKVTNAYENNLKNISLDIPLNKIVSVIGVSGSGKSTLIYSVLANEAKRREKIDSGNANCLDYATRAGFDKIENLPYCITLKQRGLAESISSTLATATKLHELLRDEIANYGEIIGDNGNIIDEPDAEDIKNFIKQYYLNEQFKLYAIVRYKRYTDGVDELSFLKKYNIEEAVFISSYDEKMRTKKVSSSTTLNSNYHHTILVPFNDIENIENYKDIAKESFLLENQNISFNFGFDYPDLETGKIYQKKSQQLLSFNSLSEFAGKCKRCDGKGIIEDIDESGLFLKDKTMSESFLNLEENGKGCYKYVGICFDSLHRDFKENKITLNEAFFELDDEQKETVRSIIYPKILKHQGKPSIGKFVQTVECPVCNGTRLNYKASAVRLFGLSISQFLSKTVDELYDFLKDKNIHHKKIIDILKALQKATLGYLSLDRTTDTLSGGEMQRLKFAIELSSEYRNLLYILDEPSSGLHAYNNQQMITLIKNIKDKGNSIVISEHNEEYIKSSDYVIALGYGSGKNGGNVIFKGDKKNINTEEFHREKLKVDLNNSIELIGVSVNNIYNENFTIPLNCLVVISGVSGSGKSSLIHEVVAPVTKRYMDDKSIDTSLVKEVKNLGKISSLVELTQSQIGLNSRSIVATYLNIFDLIRELYATTDISKEFGFDKSYFSFNSSIGACETCSGLGEVKDGSSCPNCLGNRYKHEVLEIRYKDINIIELLNKSIDKMTDFFENDKLKFAIDTLQKLGLSYLSFGRKTLTLSGGEAQRLKLAKSLIESRDKIKKGNFLFILDEPTAGLNSKDIIKLYNIFSEILSSKNSIIIIEHNLDIVKNSDFIIDIGIGSGKAGGKNIFSGNFDELIKHKTSLTAKALRGEFEKSESIEVDKPELKEKKYTTTRQPDCRKFYLSDRHFDIEKQFARDYKVATDNNNHVYFKSKDKLFEFCTKVGKTQISFNPYVAELYKYKVVPLGLKKDKVKKLKKLGFKVNINDYDKNEWDYRVLCDDVEKAYNFGNGWITIRNQNHNYELFTRLVSIENKIVGSPEIGESTFNLYLNSCDYCKGEGFLYAYDEDLIIKNAKASILENGFFHSNIKINIKTAVNKFKQECLFDFTKTYASLSSEERNIFLFGFKEYKFLKPKGRINALSDYIEWHGLHAYIYQNLSKIDIADEILNTKQKRKCPFCENGFSKEVKHYYLDGKNIVSFLNEE